MTENVALFRVAIAADGGKNLAYLEACVRGYLGNPRKPLMLLSVLEHYFLGTYNFDAGRYYADVSDHGGLLISPVN